MNIFNKRKSLKVKVNNIDNEIKQLIQKILDEKFNVLHYGAYDINPKFLVFWICVDTDATKEKLAKDDALNKQLKDILFNNDYPLEAISDVYIGFESQETVNRDSDGDWYLHFK